VVVLLVLVLVLVSQTTPALVVAVRSIIRRVHPHYTELSRQLLSVVSPVVVLSEFVLHNDEVLLNTKRIDGV
jgi:hypothetical protein